MWCICPSLSVFVPNAWSQRGRGEGSTRVRIRGCVGCISMRDDHCLVKIQPVSLTRMYLDRAIVGSVEMGQYYGA